MRTKLVVLVASAVTLFLAIFPTTTSSQASTRTVDLGITGGTVAGYTSAQAGQELPVSFTIINHSKTSSAEISFNFTVTHAAANSTFFTCPLINNHFNINPDGSSCEVGALGHGKSTSAAIMVSARNIGTVTVKACAALLDSHTDPDPSNNCTTISIPIE